MTDKLPKSLQHWAEKAGFYNIYGRRWRRDGYYIGRSKRSKYCNDCLDDSRRIRIAWHSEFMYMEICDGNFDRWANSCGAEVDRIPQTEAEFNEILKQLLQDSERNRNET